jgi:hypothetical protein
MYALGAPIGANDPTMTNRSGVAHAIIANSTSALPCALCRHKIEHRMFCHITQNWRGKPLVSHDIIINLIAGTVTKTGLEIRAELDRGIQPELPSLTKNSPPSI